MTLQASGPADRLVDQIQIREAAQVRQAARLGQRLRPGVDRLRDLERLDDADLGDDLGARTSQHGARRRRGLRRGRDRGELLGIVHASEDRRGRVPARVGEGASGEHRHRVPRPGPAAREARAARHVDRPARAADGGPETNLDVRDLVGRLVPDDRTSGALEQTAHRLRGERDPTLDRLDEPERLDVGETQLATGEEGEVSLFGREAARDETRGDGAPAELEIGGFGGMVGHGGSGLWWWLSGVCRI